MGEELAARTLRKQGYRVICRNHRTPLGEIDMVAEESGHLVFIEVKTRRGTSFGEPKEAVSAKKREKLRNLARYYLKEKNHGDVACRFDVVSIVLDGSGPPGVELIKDAF
jgi:putative endonuclease